MSITKFNCQCGNNDPHKATEYDGSLGYEALVCNNCGSFHDHDGIHPADTWSINLVGLTHDQVQQNDSMQSADKADFS